MPCIAVLHARCAGSGPFRQLASAIDSIPHDELIKSMARRVVDAQVLWLKAPIEERDEDGARRMHGGKGNACADRLADLLAPSV